MLRFGKSLSPSLARALCPFMPQDITHAYVMAGSRCSYSAQTQKNREVLGLEPRNEKGISFTGPQTASDQAVLRSSHHDNRRLTTMIKRAAQARDWQAAVIAFKEASSPDAVLYSVLLHAADKCHRPQEAFTIYDDMCLHEVPMTQSHFASLIRLAGRNGQHEKALAFKADACRRGVELNDFIYAALIDCYKRMGNSNGAYELWVEAKAAGVAMTPPLLSVLMSAIAQTGDVPRTEALLEEASGHFAPNRVHLNCLLDACKRAGDSEAAFRILAEHQARGVIPDVISFTLLLAALRSAAQPLQDVEGVLRQMQYCGVRPDKFFVEEHVGCVLNIDIIPLASGRLDALHDCQRDAVQKALDLLNDYQRNGIALSRLAEDVHSQLSHFLSTANDSAGPQWIRVVQRNPCAQHSNTPSEYFWDRTSGRTQWERPSALIVDTVEAAPTA